jgi:hypothetical protein
LSPLLLRQIARLAEVRWQSGRERYLKFSRLSAISTLTERHEGAPRRPRQLNFLAAQSVKLLALTIKRQLRQHPFKREMPIAVQKMLTNFKRFKIYR